MPDQPIYIILTRQMALGWMHSIARLGLHDTKLDLPPSTEELNQFRYYRYECQQPDETSMRCGKDSFNLAKGTVNGQPVLSRVVQTKNGFIEHVKDFNQPNRYTLLIENIDTMPDRVFILPHQIWSSSFNQLYSLGIYYEKRVKLIVDRFPHIRVYEILR